MVYSYNINHSERRVVTCKPTTISFTLLKGTDWRNFARRKDNTFTWFKPVTRIDYSYYDYNKVDSLMKTNTKLKGKEDLPSSL